MVRDGDLTNMHMNNTPENKQVDILLLQHNNPYAVILERQIFAEAVEQKKLRCASETQFKGIRAILSRRKAQVFIGKFTKRWILNNTVLDNYLNDCKKNNRTPIVLFLNSFFTEIRYPTNALSYIKKKYGAFFVLYYIDTVKRDVSTYANYLREKSIFDLVFTFDKTDAKAYDLVFWQTPYSVMNVEISNCKDLYFCGVDTDRTNIINAISHIKNIDYAMDLIQAIEKKEYVDDRITVHSVNEVMPYKDVLKRTLEANCILEIVRPGQNGFTLRTLEAVVYNKKLLTNNECVTRFPFYNPEYMNIFKNVDDIDWAWVKEKIDIDYHYDGTFSPIRLIEKIKILINSNL